MRVRGLAIRTQRLSALAFRQRELFLRTDDRVSYLNLSPRRQMIAATILAAGVAWCVCATGTYFLDNVRFAGAERQAAELRQRNAAAAAELADLQGRIAGMSAAQEEVAGERDALVRRVGELEGRLAMLDADQQTLLARLARRASSSTKIEGAIAMIGLDVNRLLQAAGKESLVPHSAAGGKGGPFVAYRPDRESKQGVLGTHDRESEIERVVSTLDQQEERGEGLRWIMAHLPLAAPLDAYRVVSGFGPRIDPINGHLAMHSGIDLANDARSAVLAAAAGRVVFAGWYGGYGRMVEIDHGMGIHTRYAHLRAILVQVGGEVAAHAQIGIIGSTGRSTGTHVHYEVLVDKRPHDPMTFMRAGEYVLSKD